MYLCFITIYFSIDKYSCNRFFNLLYRNYGLLIGPDDVISMYKYEFVVVLSLQKYIYDNCWGSRTKKIIIFPCSGSNANYYWISAPYRPCGYHGHDGDAQIWVCPNPGDVDFFSVISGKVNISKKHNSLLYQFVPGQMLEWLDYQEYGRLLIGDKLFVALITSLSEP